MGENENRYEEIMASDELKTKVKRVIRRDRFQTAAKGTGVSLVLLLVVSGMVLNLVPSLAIAAEKVPVIGSITRVLTLNRYQYEEDGYMADINMPVIDTENSSDVIDTVNKELEEKGKDLIKQFEKDVADAKEAFGDETVHMGIASDYEIKTDNETFLSIDYYTYNVVGSSTTEHTFYTYDKTTDELLTLSRIFKKDSDYAEVINAYINDEVERLIQEERGFFPEKITKEEHHFYINDLNQLVICFDKYEISAGYEGSPEFVIPEDVIKGILDYDQLYK